MKFKKINKAVALSVAAAMLLPATASAAESFGLVRHDTVTPETLEAPQDSEETPEAPMEAPPENPVETPTETPQPESPIEPETPIEPENPGEPEAPGDSVENPEAPEVPESPENPVEPETPGDSVETPSEPEVPEAPEPDEQPDEEQGIIVDYPGQLEEEENEPEEEIQDATQNQPDAPPTNEELIANQEILELPEIEEDFRFWTVARSYAFAKEELTIREEQSDSARAVGTLPKDGLCYLLEEREDGWCYVESGQVRGFVRSEELNAEDEAKELLAEFQKEARALAQQEKQPYIGITSVAPLAEGLLSPQENKAFSYLRATTQQTLADKHYALADSEGLNIREEQNADSRIVGRMRKGMLCCLLADEDSEWIFVESGDVRGFVKADYLRRGEEVEKEVLANGEDSYAVAEQLLAPKENAACYYTYKSVRPALQGGKIRRAVLEYASRFIGNPYVWGGTSLTNGADCSGFVQSIFREFGYTLPRVSRDQAHYGTKIRVEDAKPADLVFYAKNGRIYHVVIAAGENKTVEAKSRKAGITASRISPGNAVWAVRVIDEADEKPLEVTAFDEKDTEEEAYGETMGSFWVGYTCGCELCQEKTAAVSEEPLLEGSTALVDPSVIPVGTKLVIDGHTFTAQDSGGTVTGRYIDLFVGEHTRTPQGRELTEVYNSEKNE